MPKYVSQQRYLAFSGVLGVALCFGAFLTLAVPGNLLIAAYGAWGYRVTPDRRGGGIA